MTYFYEIDKNTFTAFIKRKDGEAIELVQRITSIKNPTQVQIVDIKTLEQAAKQYIESLNQKDSQSKTIIEDGVEKLDTSKPISKFDFLRLFTFDELVKLKQHSEPKIQVFMDLFNAAQEVHLGSEYVQKALQTFVEFKILTEDRTEQIKQGVIQQI